MRQYYFLIYRHYSTFSHYFNHILYSNRKIFFKDPIQDYTLHFYIFNLFQSGAVIQSFLLFHDLNVFEAYWPIIL